MIFTIERPIADQLVESILDYPEEWEIGLVSGKPRKHCHKNGVEVWVDELSCSSVELWSPSILRGIELAPEDKQRIYNAVHQIRKENEERRLEKARKTLFAMMNKGKHPGKDPINTFNYVAWAAIGMVFAILAFIVMIL